MLEKAFKKFKDYFGLNPMEDIYEKCYKSKDKIFDLTENYDCVGTLRSKKCHKCRYWTYNNR